MPKGVLKIQTATGFKWCHFSKKGNTVKLRYFGPNYIGPETVDCNRLLELEQEAESFSVQQIAALTEDVLEFSADKIPVDTDEGIVQWIAVFNRLNELGDVHPAERAERNQIVPQTERAERNQIIPQTRLRRFYECLRMFDDEAVAGSMARYLIGAEGARVEKVKVIIEESMRHFSRYQNYDEGFHNRVIPDWFMHCVNNEKAFAKCLVARMQQFHHTDCTIENHPNGSTCRAIDYEISPFRTTNHAAFENGNVGTSGGGGIDLLLRDCESGLPIIGEIKAATDRDLFLALIQALTYAIEMTTAHQFQRLANTYPLFRALDINNPKCDVFIISQSGHTHLLAEEAKSLVRLLLRDNNAAVSSVIRRVCFIDASIGGNNQVSFRCTTCIP